MLDYLKRAQAVSKHSGRVAKKARRARRGAKATKNAFQARKQIVKTNNARRGIFVE